MKVSQFLECLGHAESTRFKVSYFNEQGTEVMVETDFVEAVQHFFGEYALEGDESIFFDKKPDEMPTVYLYVGTIKKSEGNA